MLVGLLVQFVSSGPSHKKFIKDRTRCWGLFEGSAFGNVEVDPKKPLAMSSNLSHLRTGQLIKDPQSSSAWQASLYELETLLRTIPRLQSEKYSEIWLQVAHLLVQKFPYLSCWIQDISHNRLNDEVLSNDKIILCGLNYLDYDILMWISYLRSQLLHSQHNHNYILELFEEARYKVGMSYYSSELHQLYITFLQQTYSDAGEFVTKVQSLNAQCAMAPHYNHAIFQSNLRSHFPSKGSTKELLLNHNHYDTISNQKLLNSLIFPFERDLVNFTGSSNNQGLALWLRYLESLKNTFGPVFVIPLFERALISTEYSLKIVDEYVEYTVSLKLLQRARSILKRALHRTRVSCHAQFLLQLVKLEVFDENYLKARDYLAQAISCNTSASKTLHELLLALEELYSCK